MANQNVQFLRDIPVRYDVDVFVAGGGPAGVAAAIAAARQGAKVFLAEEQACLGGLGTAGMVPAYMCFGDGINFCAAALGEEFLKRLWSYGPEEYGASQSYSIRAELLKRVYEDMMIEAGADFTLHTKLVAVESDGKNIQYCVLAAKSGVYAVKAKVYIDGTGDADLAYWSGVPCDKGDSEGRMMAGTLPSLWSNIHWNEVSGPDSRAFDKAFEDGVFVKPDRHLPGMWKITEDIGGGNIGHVFGVDGTDERSLTDGLVYTRKLYDQYETYYKKYLSGYQDMELVATASMLGIRETRRIRGEYTLVLDDFLTQANFDDEIGRYCYPVDIHASDNSQKSFEKFHKEHHGYRYKQGENYGVPYRIIVPQVIDNLLVAGRCVSTDRPMQSSIRVMPGCYITGQAAGVAAAQCAKEGTLPRNADVRRIQKVLKDMGMYLPNFKA